MPKNTARREVTTRRAGPFASAGCDDLPTVPLTATRWVPTQSILSGVTAIDWPPCSIATSGNVTGVSESTVMFRGVERPTYFCGEAIEIAGPGSRPARYQPAAAPASARTTAAMRMSLKKRIL